jgi:hypothetical protein
MKTGKATLLFLAVLLGVTASAAAVAQHRHHGGHGGHYGGARFGLFIGAPAFWYGAPYYYNRYPYYDPYYYPNYYPRTVGPTTYVEQGQGDAPPVQSAPSAAPSYWYFCRESGTYYPYVNQCAGPWQRVSPQPPS